MQGVIKVNKYCESKLKNWKEVSKLKNSKEEIKIPRKIRGKLFMQASNVTI